MRTISTQEQSVQTKQLREISTFSAPAPFMLAIEQRATAEGMTKSELIRAALRAYGVKPEAPVAA